MFSATMVPNWPWATMAAATSCDGGTLYCLRTSRIWRITPWSSVKPLSAAGLIDAALAWASTITIAAGTGGFAVIELDSDELADGYPYLQVNITDPGTAKLASGVAILSGGRYQEDITATVIV